MKLVKMSLAAAAVCALATVSYADEAKPKRTLKNNVMEVYNVKPGKAESLTSMFADGVLYGRLRSNWFQWDWTEDSSKNNKAFAVGGSLIYKTASLYGVSATAGLYYADSPFTGMRMDDAAIGNTKAGKDTFSRYNVMTTGDWSMASLAQAYIQYDISKTSVKIGRQIFESFLTKSNDTKMIPNTFQGYSVETKDIPDTRLRGAYFTKQKLRDHTTFHDVVTFKDASGNSWNNNDDAGVHKGLTYANFVAAGADVNHALVVADAQNKSVKNLQLDLTYGLVPDVVSSVTAEANYKIALGGDYTLTPGVRYMMQMDEGGGAIGGASLRGGLAGWTPGDATKGYADPTSLDGSLLAARMVVKNGPGKFQIGYSDVSDDADILAMWRGFVTGGYTRAMAQYNWFANTKTWDVEAFYDFGKAKLVPGFRMMARYAMQDFDETKQAAGNQADSNVIHIDMWKKFKAIPNFEAKVRLGFISADDRVAGGDKDSYNEYRFELNYLF